MAPSSRNGSWMEKFEAPTSFMMPVSRLRLNAATRIVFTIRITETRIISSARPAANHCTQLSTLKNFSSSAFWSWTCSTPGPPDEGAGDDVELLGVDQLDPERLRHLVGGDVVDDRGVLELLLEAACRPAAWTRSRPSRPGASLSRSARIGSRWSWVTSPAAQLPAAPSPLSAPQRKTDTSTLSYQKSFITLTCWLNRTAVPRKPSETAVVMIMAMVMVRLRRSPMPISLTMKLARMPFPVRRGRVRGSRAAA